MIDLTRALYLGLTHPSASLAPWPSLTSGRPAVLDEGNHDDLCVRLAALLGTERVALAPSTLHVVIDLYGALPVEVRTVYVDACAYPITMWGLERARLRGVRVRRYRGLRELQRRLSLVPPRSSLIVTDSICVACGKVKPLARLADLAERTGSWLVVDDSQGVGLLGDHPGPLAPYGRGGGGTLRWLGASPARVMLHGSLAKALGAPLAFFAGSAAVVRWFEELWGTRVHASPCSAASRAALRSALDVCAERGDELRARLLQRVRQFRAAADGCGGHLQGGVWPVQATRSLEDEAARHLQRRLQRRGVRSVRLRREPRGSSLAFIVTAAHGEAEIAHAGAVVGEELRGSRDCAA